MHTITIYLIILLTQLAAANWEGGFKGILPARDRLRDDDMTTESGSAALPSSSSLSLSLSLLSFLALPFAKNFKERG